MKPRLPTLPPDTQPFLKLPFANQSYQLTEGWRYSEAESKIHGIKYHGGIDFELPYGTPIIAPLSGWAISSYFIRPVFNEDSQPRHYRNKIVYIGTGYFVQIYHPAVKLFTLYAHLSRIDPAIKVHAPRSAKNFHQSGLETYYPVGHKVLPQDLPNYPFATQVKEGQTIGYVGDSGIGWGYVDYPTRPDRQKFPAWDPDIHLHFEIFTRRGSKLLKRGFDPYGLKDTFDKYPDSHRPAVHLGQKSPLLWLLDSTGKPQFIRH